MCLQSNTSAFENFNNLQDALLKKKIMYKKKHRPRKIEEKKETIVFSWILLCSASSKDFGLLPILNVPLPLFFPLFYFIIKIVVSFAHSLTSYIPHPCLI